MNKTERASLGGKAVSKDREHMARIGRIGGLKSSEDKEHMRRLAKLAWVGRKKKKVDRIQELENALTRIGGMCGNPDAVEGCRNILKVVKEALKAVEGG